MSILQSPRRSACKHARSLQMSDRSVRRVLQQEFQFHLYKIAVVQELSQRNFALRQAACETLVETLPQDGILFCSDEAQFHLSGYVNMQNM